MNLPLTSQVCSLPISQEIDRLHKERGIEMESHFWWWTGDSGNGQSLHNEKHRFYDNTPAYTVSELGEMLHPHSYSIKGQSEKVKDKWICRFWGESTQDAILREHKATIGNVTRAETEADARGLMYLHLLKNNLITNT